MAPLPIIGNAVRVALNWNTQDGVSPRNIFHLITNSTDEAEIASELDTALAAGGADIFGTLYGAYLLESYTITLLSSASAGQVIPSNGTVSGGSDGAQIPAVCGVLSFHTNQRGARGRGRMYIGPIGENDVVAGLITGTIPADCVDAWNTFNDDIAASPIAASLGVASYTHADIHGVTSISMRAQCATQRRRQDQLV